MRCVGGNHGSCGPADHAVSHRVCADVPVCARLSDWRACGFGAVSDGGIGFRFGLAAAILSGWALVAKVTWPTGRTLVHVLISGLLAQGLLFTCLYLALLHGAPAVLGAVIISMNPVVTALLAATFLGERLTRRRCVAGARRARRAGRLRRQAGDGRWGRRGRPSFGGVPSQRRRGRRLQQKFCRGVDFRDSGRTSAGRRRPRQRLEGTPPKEGRPRRPHPDHHQPACASSPRRERAEHQRNHGPRRTSGARPGTFTAQQRGDDGGNRDDHRAQDGRCAVQQGQVKAGEQQPLSQQSADQHVHQRATCGPCHLGDQCPPGEDGGSQPN